MQSPIPTEPPILVTGPTGRIGTELIRMLAESGRRVRALVRNPEKAGDFGRYGDRVEVVMADLSRPETLDAAFAGIEKLLLTTNGPGLPVQEANALDAAARARVRHIVKISGRHLDVDFMAGGFTADAHAAGEKRLRGLGIPWTILRPGVFASNLLDLLHQGGGTVALPAGEGRDTPTDPRDIAAVAEAAMTTPGHEGKVYEITGPEYLTYRRMVEIMAVESGRPLQYLDLPESAFREGALAAGLAPPFVEALVRYFSDGVKGEKILPPTSTVEDVLGRPPRRFADWAREHAASLSF